MNPSKCDHCDKPAVVHELVQKGGVKKEVHLCLEHAQQAGVALPASQPINQLLKQFMLTSKTGASASRSCTACGLSFARFRQAGTLGCPECYRAFEDLLAPLIERAHNGATQHRGRAPRRAAGSVDRQLVVQQLMKELDQAVASEQYERAAELRDRLRTLKLDPRAPAGPEQAPGAAV
jgi:protein arginine kinase activator